MHIPGGNTVARTRPNDYNNMQHPQMLDEKFDQFSNLSQQYSTCRNTSQHIATGWTNVNNMFILRPTMLRYIALNVAIVSPCRAELQTTKQILTTSKQSIEFTRSDFLCHSKVSRNTLALNKRRYRDRSQR